MIFYFGVFLCEKNITRLDKFSFKLSKLEM